jgi:hypothetical protein
MQHSWTILFTEESNTELAKHFHSREVSGRQRHKLQYVLRGRQIGFVVKNKEQTRKTNQKQKEMKYNGGL